MRDDECTERAAQIAWTKNKSGPRSTFDQHPCLTQQCAPMAVHYSAISQCASWKMAPTDSSAIYAPFLWCGFLVHWLARVRPTQRYSDRIGTTQRSCALPGAKMAGSDLYASFCIGRDEGYLPQPLAGVGHCLCPCAELPTGLFVYRLIDRHACCPPHHRSELLFGHLCHALVW